MDTEDDAGTHEMYLTETPQPHVPVSSPTRMSQKTVLTICLVVGLIVSTALGALLYVSLHAITLQRQATVDRDTKARDAKATILANRQTGLRNRAAVCEGQYVFGLRFKHDSECVSPDVLRYWSPEHLTSYVPVAGTTAPTAKP